MALDPTQTTQEVSDSIGAMLLLDSSCQAIIEASLAPSSSPWYETLDQELGAAEELVVAWRQNGYLYFQQEILGQIAGCGTGFLTAQPSIDELFASLESTFDPAVRDEIVSRLDDLEAPVQAMVDGLTAYTGKLAAFEKALAVPAAQMSTSIAQIQAQEQQIEAQISAINAKIAALQQQVQTDREAIAKAEAQRTSGIVETIFGVLLAPFTGGVSLVLAGIGVATITEAQEKVNSLEDTIAGYQSTIAGDQQNLNSDEQQVATLSGLTMTMSLAMSDVMAIDSALDSLRTTWTVLLNEIQNAAANVAKAQTAQEAAVAQVWFDAACIAWGAIVPFVENMSGQSPPDPTVVPVGQ